MQSEKISLFDTSRKIVVKIGTNTLSCPDGSLDSDFISRTAQEVKELCELGKKVAIVTSGAVIAGVAALGRWRLKTDIHYKQALSAIGQVRLMEAYHRLFGDNGMTVAQLLLTAEDFSDPNRTLHIRNTLFSLFEESVVPIVNENDSVSVDEIKIGDNDNLSALTAILWSADLLVNLSDIDGVYDSNPRKNKEARHLPRITHDEAMKILDKEDMEGGRFGTGGIRTKIAAAKRLSAHGIPMILANGKREGILHLLQKGSVPFTLFPPG